MDDWLLGILTYKDESLPKMILGNKIDMEENRVVTDEEVEEYTAEKGI